MTTHFGYRASKASAAVAMAVAFTLVTMRCMRKHFRSIPRTRDRPAARPDTKAPKPCVDDGRYGGSTRG